MDENLNKDELELTPAEDKPVEPTTAEEAKTESGYEQNDNWEFEAKAFTLDETMVESDEYQIKIPEKMEEDATPSPAAPVEAPAPEAEQPVAKTEKAATPKKEKKSLNSNTIKFIFAGTMLAVIIAALTVLGLRYYTLPNANEQMNPGNVAMTVDDVDVSIGMYNYYYSCITQNYLSYAEYGYYEDLDVTKDFSKQTTTDEDGKKITWQKLFEKETKKQIQYITSYYKAAVDAGITLTKDQQKQIDENIASIKESAAAVDMSVDQYITTNYGDYCGLATLKKMLEQCMVAESYYYQAMVETKATDKEIASYIKKNGDEFKNVSFAFLQFQYGETNKNETKKKAAKYASQIKNIKDLKKALPEACTDIIDGYVEAGYYEDAESCAKALADSVEVTIARSETGLVDSAMEWLFSADTKVNDCKYFDDEETSMFYVLLKTSDPKLDDQEVYSVRHILIMPGNQSEEDEDSEQKTEFTDAEWATAEKKAEKILAEFNKGKKTEYEFAKLAEKYSQDTESTSNGSSGMYGGLYAGTPLGRMVKSFEKWSTDKAREYGDTAIVKSDYGYHIMYFVGDYKKYEYDAASKIATQKQEKVNDDAEIKIRNGMKKVKVAQPKAKSESQDDAAESQEGVVADTQDSATEPATEAAATEE